MYQSPVPPSTPQSTTPSTPTSNQSINPLNHQLSDYRVIRVLGSGSFGQVSLVERITDGARYVWKAVHYGSMTVKEKRQLVSEVNFLRSLRHPHIVEYFDRLIDRSSSMLYIVMEHCEKGDLSSAIEAKKKRSKKFRLSFIWRVLFELSDAIATCHSRNCVHRDIKPSNVLINSNGSMKLADFGLARAMACSRHQQTHAGTPYYMSPEQMSLSHASEKSDVWAIGCLAYELATLSTPFQAQNAVMLAKKVESGLYNTAPLDEYGSELKDAIQGMLTVDVEQRWTVQQIHQTAKQQLEIIRMTNDRLNNQINQLHEHEPLNLVNQSNKQSNEQFVHVNHHFNNQIYDELTNQTNNQLNKENNQWNNQLTNQSNNQTNNRFDCYISPIKPLERFSSFKPTNNHMCVTPTTPTTPSTIISIPAIAQPIKQSNKQSNKQSPLSDLAPYDTRLIDRLIDRERRLIDRESLLDARERELNERESRIRDYERLIKQSIKPADKQSNNQTTNQTNNQSNNQDSHQMLTPPRYQVLKPLTPNNLSNNHLINKYRSPIYQSNNQTNNQYHTPTLNKQIVYPSINQSNQSNKLALFDKENFDNRLRSNNRTNNLLVNQSNSPSGYMR